MLSYQEFWEKLEPAYPISKGKFHLPIASSLEHFKIDQAAIILELDQIMQQLFMKNEEAKPLAKAGFGDHFVACYQGNFTGVVRFDTMFDQNGNLKVVEANTNWPDGLLMHDVTYGVLAGKEDHTHLDLFVQFFDPKEHLFILYEASGFLDPHFLEAQLLKERGYQVSIGTFDQLEIKDHALWADGKKIDVMRLSMSSGRLSPTQHQILAQSQIRFVNSFDLAGLGNKSLLEDIESPMMMKTLKLTKENADLIIENKDHYVLKPSNLDEGQGILIGIDCRRDEWEQSIRSKLDQHYLAQEYISIQPKMTAMYQEGKSIESLQYYDYCPHLFYREGKLLGVGHSLVRYSPGKIVNVLRGGGIGYARREKE